MTPDVSAVVVTYRAATQLPGCLDALEAAREGLALESIVVDNASADDTVAVASARPELRLLRNETNRGFAAAANRGAREARGRYLLFLNPDARPSQGCLATQLAVLEEEQRAGLAGPLLVWPDGTPQPSAWAQPSLLTLAFEAFLLRNLWPRSRLDHLEIPAVGRTLPVPCLSGACLLARRACFEAVHGFDESFFLYHEDWDLCLRARAAGWSSLLVAGASALHDRGASAFLDRREFWRRYHESRDLLIGRHFRGGRRVTARALHRTGLRLHAAAARVAGREEEARHLADALRALPRP